MGENWNQPSPVEQVTRQVSNQPINQPINQSTSRSIDQESKQTNKLASNKQARPSTVHQIHLYKVNLLREEDTNYAIANA